MEILKILFANPFALIGCILLAFGILFTFVSKKFILIRLFFKDVSFIKQRLIGIILGLIGAFLLYWSTGNLN